MFRFLRLAWVSLLLLRGVAAQNFEVASIRPHPPGDTAFRVKPPIGGRFTATGSVASFLLMLAYDVPETQIVGGPGWLATEKWDIEAASDDQKQHSIDETRLMLQHLLEERFALKTHREKMQRPVYVLTVVKGGPTFKSSGPDGSMNIRVSANSITLERGQLARMTQLLSTTLGRPVVDRTGLTGLYDLSLQWDDAPGRDGVLPGLDAAVAADPEHGSIFTAIQEQLGLRLEPQRAEVEVIVIDRIEKPSAN
ncbi:MAG TPA: TIGR03435 family protein [Bryobacteraceae bacterium]